MDAGKIERSQNIQHLCIFDRTVETCRHHRTRGCVCHTVTSSGCTLCARNCESVDPGPVGLLLRREPLLGSRVTQRFKDGRPTERKLFSRLYSRLCPGKNVDTAAALQLTVNIRIDIGVHEDRCRTGTDAFFRIASDRSGEHIQIDRIGCADHDFGLRLYDRIRLDPRGYIIFPSVITRYFSCDLPVKRPVNG